MTYLELGANDKPSTFSRKDDPPISELPECFVDRYTTWASTCTDAPVQYHSLNGFIVLSSVLCPYLELEMNYGKFKPNLFGMILAGTTLTRKSTSMNLAIGLLDEVIPDYLMATEGTPEGILCDIERRDGSISMFHRDEITGWIEQTSKKDYLSGLLETFTKMYDGTPERRVLKNTVIEIRNPNLVVMSGGIKSRMQEVVNMEHIRSGFLPRFIIVSGTTTAEERRPIGPRIKDDYGRDPRETVLEELYGIANWIMPNKAGSGDPITVGNVIAIPKTTKKTPVRQMTATPEAWERMQQLKLDAETMGDTSDAPQIYNPLLERLSNSLIKISMLIAAARRTTVIEYEDVVKAISYSDKWLESTIEFATGLEIRPSMTPWERKLDDVIGYLQNKQPERSTRTELMRRFRINKRMMDELEQTMEQRDLIKAHITKRSSGAGRPLKEYELLVEWKADR